MFKQYLLLPTLFSCVALAAVFAWGGVSALAVAAFLVVLEVTLSFDNAIVNAEVLEKMPPIWRRRFLTWGILTSVVGVRLVLPILIVSAVVWASPFSVALLAFGDPVQYAALIERARPAIEAFGGMFLFMVALRYFFDETKEIHWLHAVEHRLARFGRVEAAAAAFSLIVLVLVALGTHASESLVLMSGIIGIITFIIVDGMTVLLNDAASVMPHDGYGPETREASSRVSARAPLALFIYLEMLDTAFSLDGVVGAFALTVLVPVMAVGLGIGALFVRSMTIALVDGGALKHLRYIEHGAHWAISTLALSMMASLVVQVPEWFTAGAGIVIIALAYWSSHRHMQRYRSLL